VRFDPHLQYDNQSLTRVRTLRAAREPGTRWMRTRQIMTRKVISVGTAASIVDAANIMLENHVSGLPVTDEAGRLVGIVSQGDFIRRAEIGTQRKRGRWLKFLRGPGRVASDFVHERGRS
jgi:CBS-domain-containing membrane protein